VKPPPFEYYSPASVDEAIARLGTVDNAKGLAGGQSLMPMLNMRFVMPDHVIDINGIAGLSEIREVGDLIEIGAMTRQRDIEFSELVRAKCPMISEAILQVGHRQTRNRGTIGGSLCHLDPAAELVAMAVAFDAVVLIAGPAGRREESIHDFIRGYMTTTLAADDIVVGVRFAPWNAGHGYGFIEFSRRHGDFAMVSAAAMLEANAEGQITRAALVIGGLDVAPRRATTLERDLIGKTPSPDILDAVCETCRSIEATDDIHATARYRQGVAVVMARRALDLAIERLSPSHDRRH
jgi:carbon-monoxide dehydrogenase medium subunit